MQSIVLSDDQQAAFDQIKSWIGPPLVEVVADGAPREISLGGYAGTGKTTLLKLLIDEVDDSLAVMALTGKAVSVLRHKGVEEANTIHSTIYYCEVEKKKLIFTLRDDIEGHPNLFIIDEASMVSTQLYKDLLSFNVPILWVGDHGQLEPVGKNPGIMKDPDVTLERIHRQAEGNPIIVFADKVRRGAAPAAVARKEERDHIEVILRSGIQEDNFLKVDQVICALNRTRVKVNKLIREKLGFLADLPTVGDRVICLKNKRSFGIFNGMQGVIKGIKPVKDFPVYDILIELDDGRCYTGECFSQQFNHQKGLIDVDPSDRSLWSVTHWDYAYCVTCHKSQGSEWDSVLVIEERCPLWSMARWRYTAVTRASERLIYAT